MVTDRTLADEASRPRSSTTSARSSSLAPPARMASHARCEGGGSSPRGRTGRVGDARGRGAYLLGMWGCPSRSSKPPPYHHRPGTVPSDCESVLAAVHIADAVADATFIWRGEGARAGSTAFWKRLASTSIFRHWRALAMGEIVRSRRTTDQAADLTVARRAMEARTLLKILCVDDEPNVLEGCHSTFVVASRSSRRRAVPGARGLGRQRDSRHRVGHAHAGYGRSS